MKETHCPICHTKLLAKKVTPCYACGGNDLEVDHYKEHKYHEYETYHKLKLVLCDFCDVDFGSYEPTYLGFEKGRRLGYEDLKLVREIEDIQMVYGKYCPECKHTLPHLQFVINCRIANGNE